VARAAGLSERHTARRHRPRAKGPTRSTATAAGACGEAAMVTVYSRSKPRVSEIMATAWSDLFQLRLTEWDEF